MKNILKRLIYVLAIMIGLPIIVATTVLCPLLWIVYGDGLKLMTWLMTVMANVTSWAINKQV
jgi:hypothetical protein